jgi:glycosyltransferase involved in cell wall biosynthesis
MRIAQVSPLYESVPPKLYGGTERVVSDLTEELVRRGHEVTLFASGDSVTRASLISPHPRSLRLDASCSDQMVYHLLLLEEVYRHADEFDLVHFHVDYLHFPFTRRHSLTHVTTLHGRLDIPDLVPLYREYREMPLVSISQSQRAPLSWAKWIATVHHGMPLTRFRPQNRPGKYLAFLGRVSAEKGLPKAIEIARRAGMPLKIAAKVDNADQEYFEAQIRPLLQAPAIEFIGEIGENEKSDFLGNAYALLFPIDWPEPFGLVMIESMACGTPVVAFRKGSVPEVLEDGVTGFICDTAEQAVAALKKIDRFNRLRCRQEFEARFSDSRMASDYLAAYARLLSDLGSGEKVRRLNAYRR